MKNVCYPRVITNRFTFASLKLVDMHLQVWRFVVVARHLYSGLPFWAFSNQACYIFHGSIAHPEESGTLLLGRLSSLGIHLMGLKFTFHAEKRLKKK